MAGHALDRRPVPLGPLRPAREGHATGEQRTLMREAARHVLVALEEFHDAGWVHGDMQTENVIHTRDGGIEFIDFDTARHPDLPLSHPYRGGLIHVIAPKPPSSSWPPPTPTT